MAELVEVPLGDGGVVVVEMDRAPTGVVKVRRRDGIVGRATETLDEALESVAPTARSVLAKLRPAGPDEIAVEFGLTLTAEAGAVIAKTASGCHLKVTLRWKPDHDSAR